MMTIITIIRIASTIWLLLLLLLLLLLFAIGYPISLVHKARISLHDRTLTGLTMTTRTDQGAHHALRVFFVCRIDAQLIPLKIWLHVALAKILGQFRFGRISRHADGSAWGKKMLQN